MSPYAGGSVPVVGDTDYLDWLRWIQLGQQDAANRGFWRRLLTKADQTITASAETDDLPANFHKINGIYALFVGGIDWSRPNNEDEMRLFVEMNPLTAVWRIRYLPDTPTTSTTGDLWYFFNPPKPTIASDIVFLDGEMIGFYALKEYFRKLKQLGSMDDARIEYENRFSELLSLEMLPSQQELASFSSFNSFKNVSTNEKRFYSGRSGRSRNF
jgi:hypothetical protein